jgi:hypothetical protein
MSLLRRWTLPRGSQGRSGSPTDAASTALLQASADKQSNQISETHPSPIMPLDTCDVVLMCGISYMLYEFLPQSDDNQPHRQLSSCSSIILHLLSQQTSPSIFVSSTEWLLLIACPLSKLRKAAQLLAA